jgi:protein TonB
VQSFDVADGPCVKSFQENRFLYLATGISLLAHGVLLAVNFVAPKNFKVEPTDPGLEVILVNAKHAKAPLKAEALAQANLDGGGKADAGRAKSPLPDMRKNETGESVKATRRRIAELEETQKNLLTQAVKQNPLSAAPVTEKSKPDPLPTGADLLESSKAIARMAAEITQTIDDQNKRPKKTFITPTTREVGYANYYKELQRRVEEIGTLNFPQKNGRKLYGELVVYIPIFQDGTIYQKDGGVRIEKSSGNDALDAAALAIVRRAAPFGRFPPNMLSSERDDLWVIITRFKFTREEKLESNLSGSN